MNKEMINLACVILFGVTAVISLCAGWHLAAAFFFAVVLVFTFRVRQDDKRKWKATRKEIHDTNQTLKSSVIETHMRLNELTHSQQSVKQNIVQLLVEAASYLGNPPAARRSAGPDYFLAWNKKGLALLDQAKTLVESELTAHP